MATQPIQIQSSSVTTQALSVVGWYTEADKIHPAHEPNPLLCAVCLNPVTDTTEATMHNLRPYQDNPRSYFYEVHNACVETEDTKTRVNALIDVLEMQNPTT